MLPGLGLWHAGRTVGGGVGSFVLVRPGGRTVARPGLWHALAQPILLSMF